MPGFFIFLLSFFFHCVCDKERVKKKKNESDWHNLIGGAGF